jgi:hypothetical protein
MYRRRRATREIAFSFDSFLDMVANVVGVIIRLILVVWVGARAYTGVVAPPADDPIPVETAAEEPADEVVAMPVEPPLENALLPHQQELARLQQQLLEQMRGVQQVRDQSALTDKEVAELTAKNVELESEVVELDRTAAKQKQRVQVVALSAQELQCRYKKLADEMTDLKKLPSLKKTLHYQTPVSEPLYSEELEFECYQGRVTFIETHALIEEVKREFESRKQEFFSSESSTARVDPVGAFRAVFHVQLERFPQRSITITEGRIEPVQDSRGENLTEAMKPTSAFRQIADVIDPKATSVTFWVYPDSFAMFRQLRDYLYDRKITVAARPIPNGSSIGWSRNGTAARGQ